MPRNPLRSIKLAVGPFGQLRRHKKGYSLPDDWTLIHDEAVFYKGELLTIFDKIPFLHKEVKLGKRKN